MNIVDVKTKGKNRRIRITENISAFKEELRAITFEPIYGDSVKDIITRLTAKIQELSEKYDYTIEFPKKADVETDGNIYYFTYNLKVKTKGGLKKIQIKVQYIMYDQEGWVGMITEIS
ncbi:hypothetical protein [Metallosphaera hakonensis]|uniref:Uncharacterized protein n=1 Tax=Metallosphaera hakonensis JCM 8857 = DSM 7519 TaxID=1293036 RepID=A0A2U9IS66_9CREN|nr:hypothetical protein [Metallosphaera hakonensis]AWR98879.1 hypothetical protein DFR87_03285 [Metallosphaera hakonensis JCM 8857 = DSM 7519]